MKINFPIIQLIQLNNKINFNNQIRLKQSAFDSFERVSFSGNPDDTVPTHSFEIKNIANLRCPVCGLIMLTDNQIDEFVNDIKDKKGYELASAFEKYEDDSCFTKVKQDKPKSIFREQKQKIVNIIKKLAIEHPEKSLSELVDFEAQRRLDILIKEQFVVVKKLEAYTAKANLTNAERNCVRVKLSEYKKEINGMGKRRFSRKRNYI